MEKLNYVCHSLENATWTQSELCKTFVERVSSQTQRNSKFYEKDETDL